jgi:hypothetical protein
VSWPQTAETAGKIYQSEKLLELFYVCGLRKFLDGGDMAWEWVDSGLAHHVTKEFTDVTANVHLLGFIVRPLSWRTWKNSAR